MLCCCLWISPCCAINCKFHHVAQLFLNFTMLCNCGHEVLLGAVWALLGQFYAITFWPKIKFFKNVKIYQNTLSRNYLCQKIVKGGWLSWIFRDPQNWKIGHFQGKVQVLYLFGNLWSATKRGWREKNKKRPGKLMLRVTRWQNQLWCSST